MMIAKSIVSVASAVSEALAPLVQSPDASEPPYKSVQRVRENNRVSRGAPSVSIMSALKAGIWICTNARPPKRDSPPSHAGQIGRTIRLARSTSLEKVTSTVTTLPSEGMSMCCASAHRSISASLGCSHVAPLQRRLSAQLASLPQFAPSGRPIH